MPKSKRNTSVPGPDPEVFEDMHDFDCDDSSKFALSVRLQFPKFSKGFTSSDFEPFIDEFIGTENLVSIGRLSFPNEWQIQVTNNEVREKLIRLGRTKIKTRSCWISPLSQSEVRGYIHWIPTATSNRKLQAILSRHGEVMFMENQKQNKWSNKVDSDSRYFALQLKSGKNMDDVPHFIKVDDEYLGLVTIRGRMPACFHCRQVGHRKTDCKVFREKMSDFCLRPPNSATKRKRPRGKRYKAELPTDANQSSADAQTSTSLINSLKDMPIASAFSAIKTVDSADSAKKANVPSESAKAVDDKKGSIPLVEPANISKSPLEQLDELQKSLSQVLSITATNLANEIEAAKKNIGSTVPEQSDSGEGKKKRRKRKKKAKSEEKAPELK